MYTVKQAAEIAGISPDAVRYYDKRGLLVAVRRDRFGGRVFDDAALEWLRVVVALKESGMSVAELERFAALRREGESTASERRRVIARQRRRLEERIASLSGQAQLLDAQLNAR